MSPRSLLGAAALAAATLIPAAVATAAAPTRKPDLRVTRVADPPASVGQGGAFAVRDTTTVSGRARATTTRYLLSPDPLASLADRRAAGGDPRTSLRDVLLAGLRPVPAGGSAGKARAGVPIGTAPGRYWLLACADDTGAVAERREDQNCRASHEPVVVTADPQATRVDGLSDAFAEPSEAEDRQALATVTPATCRLTLAAPRRPLTERAALASLRAFLTQHAGAGLRAFAASPDARTATTARTAAVRALVAGRPGAALAATLRAQQLQPRVAAHLENAAALAVVVGRPAEALALLDAAARRPADGTAPMGIARRSSSLTVRATALARLGRPEQAAAVAALARAGDPALAEAQQVGAAAQACATGPDAALALLRAGRRRTPGIPRADVSGGVASPLRAIPLPALPENAVAMRAFYRGELDTAVADSAALAAREQTLQAQVRAYTATLPPAGRHRVEGLERLALTTHQVAGAQAAQTQIDHELTAAQTTIATFFGDGSSADSRYDGWRATSEELCEGAPDFSACFRAEIRSRCIPEARIAHQTVLDHVSTAYRLSEALQRAQSTRLSGLAGNLFADAPHARILLLVERDEQALYGGVLQAIEAWSTSLDLRADHCVSAPDPPVALPPSAAPAAASSGQCPPWLSALAGKVALGDFSVKATCEKIEVSGGIGEGWITAFGDVSYDVRANRITVYAGSKGGHGVGPLEAEFKSGLYLVTSAQGVEDVGWRVGPGATVGAGPLEYQLLEDQVDISFVPVFSAVP